MRRKCFGYRDQSDLMFRDESARTREKARRSNVPNSESLSTSLSYGALADVLVAQGARADPRLLHGFGLPLSPSAEDFAICHFYHTTLANLSTEDPTRYIFEQLPALYGKSKTGSALHLATQAISYATLKKSMHEATHLSRKRYMRAVKAAGEAIQDRFEVKNDQTLYAILLLCGYETIMCDSKSLPAWGAHVDGAAAVVKTRNCDSQSQLSRNLFLFVRKSVVLSQIQTSQPVDGVFTELDEVMSSHGHPEAQLISSMTKIPTLQYLANDLLTQPRCNSRESEVRELLNICRLLDCEILHWAINTPSTWSYSAAPRLDTLSGSGFSPAQVHRYPDFYVARVWNLYRVSRLIIHSILLRAIAWLLLQGFCLNEYDTSKLEKSTGSLVNDICASVPFLLGHDVSKMRLPNTSNTEKQTTNPPIQRVTGNDNDLASMGKFSLIWPLYVGCSAPSVPEAQRRWMRTQLRHIASHGEWQAHFASLSGCQTLHGGAETFRFDCV